MVSDPVQPFVIRVTIRNIPTSMGLDHGSLVDSGCTRCLIRRAVVEKLGICMKQLHHPITFEQIDGSTLGGAPATHVIEPVRLEIEEHQEDFRFIVIDKMIEPIILGLVRLDKLEPTIGVRGDSTNSDWPYGLSHLTHHKHLGGRGCNRSMDCAIELIPGAKLPKSMYSMTLKEMEELRCYIDRNLARGFIQPSRSHMAALILCREKKDGSLQLCVDFCGLSAACVEHLYPLPLMQDLLATLANRRIFTKLDLHEVYYQVRI